MWRSLARANLAYAIGSAANSAASLLLVPFLVHALPPEGYGALALFEVVILLLSMVIVAGLDVGMMRHYWSLEDEALRKRMAGTVLGAVALWGGVVFLISWAITQSRMGTAIPGGSWPLVLSAACAWAESCLAVVLGLFRIRERALGFVLLSSGRMILYLVSAVSFVRLGYGVAGALAGRVAAAVVVLIIALVTGSGLLSFRPDMGAFGRVLRYGIPLLPANLASYVLLASDRFFLQHFTSLETVAVYTFAYKVATLLDVAVTRPFALDWAPRRFKIEASAHAASKYAQIGLAYLFVAVTFALLIVAATPSVYAWFAPGIYHPGIGIVPVIVGAYLVFGLSYPLNIGIMLRDKTGYLVWIGVLASAACLGLNSLWIPRYGMQGAAWATAVSYAVWTALIAVVSLRLYPVRYPWQHAFAVVAVGSMGFLCLQAYDRAAFAGEGVGALAGKAVFVLCLSALVGYMLRRQSRVVVKLPEAGFGDPSSSDPRQ